MTLNCVHFVGPDITDETTGGQCAKARNTYDLTDLVKLLQPSTFIISAHGSISNETHYFQDKDGLLPTALIVHYLSKNKPVQLVLTSCYSGTNTEDLITQLAPGSAVITTSPENKESLRFLNSEITQIIKDNELDLVKSISSNLHILAASFVKYTTYDGVFSLLPPVFALESRETAKQYLLDAGAEFDNFMGEEISRTSYEDSEVDLFAQYLLKMFIANFDTQLMEYFNQSDQYEYLDYLLQDETTHRLIHTMLFASDNVDLLKLLLAHGLKTTSECCIYAIDTNKIDFLKAFLEYGELEQFALRKIYNHVIDENKNDFLKILLEHNGLDSDNFQTLHNYAIYSNNMEAFKILLDYDGMNQFSLTLVLIYALSNNKTEALNMLKEHDSFDKGIAFSLIKHMQPHKSHQELQLDHTDELTEPLEQQLGGEHPEEIAIL